MCSGQTKSFFCRKISKNVRDKKFLNKKVKSKYFPHSTPLPTIEARERGWETPKVTQKGLARTLMTVSACEAPKL
jgi:hypothetical protein